MLAWWQPEDRCLAVPTRDTEGEDGCNDEHESFEQHRKGGTSGGERGVGLFEIGKSFVDTTTEFRPLGELVLRGCCG